MIESWVKTLRSRVENLSERGAAKQLRQAVDFLDDIPPFSNMPLDSGDVFCVVWYDAWASAILTGAALLSECSLHAHTNRNIVMGIGEILDPEITSENLRKDFSIWERELKTHKPQASQDCVNICSGFTPNVGMFINFDFSEIFCVPNFDSNDDEKVEILEDQIWQHKDCQDVKVQILKVDNGDVDVIVVGRFSEAQHSWFLGEQCSFNKSDFVKNWSLYKDIGSGAICKKCKQDYPFAMNSKDFVCYSCRNGWS